MSAQVLSTRQPSQKEVQKWPVAVDAAQSLRPRGPK